MIVRAIKTAETEAAVNRIRKLSSKKFDLGVSFNVPKEFIEKREYMQSDEFIKDEHNSKMLELGDDLYYHRLNIGKEIGYLNQKMSNKFVQAINGFARLKSDIEKNFYINFEDIPMEYTPSEIQYRIIRNLDMFVATKKQGR